MPGAQLGYNPSYAPPPGPPPHGFGPPPGPPPSGYGPPAGPPPSGYGPPLGPPPDHRGHPGQPSHNSGYPGQQQQHQQPQAGFPGRQAHNSGYPAGPPPRPPTQVQNYGPQFQGPNHQQSQPFFQYSQCNGKKKALCVGINYFGSGQELKGCINDVHNMKNFLMSEYGYKSEDIVTLTDDATNPRMKPTRENILQAMQWLVRGAQPNDSLFFHYSGHGGQTKDLDGDEGDGYDEVIYPLDFESNGHIVDDLMHDIMVKPLPAGCRLTAIYDSCHSGTALDLPYVYSTEGKIKEPNIAAEAGQGLLSAVTSYARGDMGGVFNAAMGLVKTATGNQQKAEKITRTTKTSPADVISWSGCKDSQTSADAQEAGQATGAMSYAFTTAIRQNKQQSYQQLLVNIREILRTKYSQKPQLSSSHPIDTNILFIC
ncbi:caspase domain-containing protein [Gymnopilus junonius]|uniref:Caspase domain-containing protein n=1 Tax=Gymnopilus junonius TaxID=109634 RepID=A0A9P5P2L9_GYMJU|nr:caspase domain-containing protein [Gymnopilus junonius]